MKKIKIIEGDITRLQVDAIVNAANNSLLGGGGVDGAIHRAAGPELLNECRTLNGCPNGKAKITQGYRLPATYVIHTVGPVWYGGHQGEESVLRSCYRESLQLAVQFDLKSIAFPAISCGVFHFPASLAAKVAIDSIVDFLTVDTSLEQIYLVCFDQEVSSAYNAHFDKLFGDDHGGQDAQRRSMA